MKAAIITINNRINLEEKNIRSLEVIYFRKYLLTKFDEVDYVSSKTKKEVYIKEYKDINDVKASDYDALYIHNSNPNLFGGVLKEDVIKNIKFINAFSGNIGYLITDPKLNFVNFAKRFFDRQEKGTAKCDVKLTRKDVDTFTRVSQSIKAIWTGRDYELYMSKFKSSEIKLEFGYNVKLFESIYEDKLNNKGEYPDMVKEYDLCYYGNNRRGYRSKRLRDYFVDSPLKNYFIGYEPGFKCNFIKYVDQKLLHREIRKAKASIVIGDKEHNNNIITARFYENIIYGVISFIDKDYDPEKRLYKNELLQQILYVDDWRGIKYALNRIEEEGLYDEIIRLQKEELKNII